MLYLDFDGVLFDSSRETLKNFNYSFNAFCLSNNVIVDDNKSINVYIKENRGSIGPIEDFFLILEELPQIDNIIEFSLIKENLPFLVSKFLEYRMIQKELSYEDWCLLHEPSPLAIICKREGFKFKIVSTKDEDSLADICKFFDLSPQQIYGKESFEKFGSKTDIIVADMHKGQIFEAAFFDDNVNHLFRNDRIKNYFVEWGYGNNTDYSIINENNLNEVLRQWI
tara:strand:+ start:1233 stop:1907 length:675 start_codon:yes stop_codon:yes gene_type:complete